MIESWDERQVMNQVPVKYDVQEAISDETDLEQTDFRAFDAQAIKQYFSNPASNKRIVVFGHTHAGCIKPSVNLKKPKIRLCKLRDLASDARSEVCVYGIS